MSIERAWSVPNCGLARPADGPDGRAAVPGQAPVGEQDDVAAPVRHDRDGTRLVDARGVEHPQRPQRVGKRGRPELVHRADPAQQHVPVTVGHHRDVTREVGVPLHAAERGRAVHRSDGTAPVEDVDAAGEGARDRAARLAEVDRARAEGGERAEEQAVGRTLARLAAEREDLVVQTQHRGRVVRRGRPVAVPHHVPEWGAALVEVVVEVVRRGRGVAPPQLRHRWVGDGRDARAAVGVVAQQLDLGTHPVERRAELEPAVARVARADAREVVVRRAHLPVVGEVEPCGLDDGLRERDVATNVVAVALGHEQLCELVERRVAGAVGQAGRRVRAVPARELGRAHSGLTQHRDPGRPGRAVGREAAGQRERQHHQGGSGGAHASSHRGHHRRAARGGRAGTGARGPRQCYEMAPGPPGTLGRA